MNNERPFTLPARPPAASIRRGCNECRSFVQAPPGVSSMRERPTPGCRRPTGFGEFAKVTRPTRGRAGRS